MDKLCGQCAWNEGGRWCRKKYKDVAYFAQEPCFTTDEEYHLLLAQDIMKVESNTKKLTQNANQMESNTNIKTKVCKECGRELPIESFQRQVKSSDGYMHICKECKTKRVLAGFSKKEEPLPAVDTPISTKFEEINIPTEYVEDFNKQEIITKISDQELVAELRKRGWTVTCTKVIEL